jgi:ArsR family transcriptional regulator
LRRERESQAARYFRDNAAQWDRLRALYIDERDIERRLVALLSRRRIAKLLDIGTGTGRILEVAAAHIEHGLGIDQSREMLGVARSNLERAGIKNCDLRQADMYALPLPDDAVDAVTIHQVLHYAEDPAAMIAEAARVLRPGGVIAVADFAPHALVELQREHAHRHLGFADNQVFGWLSAAGLRPDAPIRLPGRQLNVTIWSAERPRPAALATRTLAAARPLQGLKGAAR